HLGGADSQRQEQGTQGTQGAMGMGGTRPMKQQAAKAYIALVAALGLVVLVASSISVRTSTIDPVMFVFILVLVGVAQRNPVVLIRYGSIYDAFDSYLIACY